MHLRRVPKIAPRFRGRLMRRARYRFDPKVRYYCWAVALRQAELPGYGRTTGAIKLTLATPYREDGARLVATGGPLEAVVWLFEEETDRELLELIGAVVHDGQYHLPRHPTPLWCQFAESTDGSLYQALDRCEPVLPGEYVVSPLVGRRVER